MSTYASQLSRLVAAQPQVTPQTIRKAAQWVAEKNCSPKAVAAFSDVFQAASQDGRLSAEARQAYREALVRLVKKVPEAGVSLTTTRLTGPQLERQLQKVQGVIEGHGTKIVELETKLAETLSRIETKTKTVDDMIARRAELQATLQRKLERRRTMLLFAAFGAFGAAGAAVGLGAAMSIGDLQREIATIGVQIDTAKTEKTRQQASLEVFRAQHEAMNESLQQLKAVEAGLRAAVADASSTEAGGSALHEVVELSRQLTDHQALAGNLHRQIELLRSMNAHASGFEAGLDSLIASLETELEGLKARIKAAERALLETVIDLVFATSGVDPNLKVGPLSFSKKRLLLDGLDYMRLAFDQQVHALVDQMVAQKLVDATGSKAIATTLVRLMRGDADGAELKGAVRRELTRQAMASLTEPQRFLVDLLMHRPPEGVDVNKLVDLVMKNTSISDPQARAMAAILSSRAAPAEGKTAEIRKVLRGRG